MKPVIAIAISIILLIASPHISAADADNIDNTIASGIVFKITYVLGAEGTWSDLEHSTPESFSRAMDAISKDLSLFSDSEHGRDLKKRGESLISFLVRGITSTAKAGAPEGKAFLEEAGLDPEGADPLKLAEVFLERIAAYAELSKTPRWVYDLTRRVPDSANPPDTGSELEARDQEEP